jgi:putative radical SAM enzyme (TIGR03279 family)
MGHIIASVPEGSLGAELGLLPGDELTRINGEEVLDVIDYQALIASDEMTLTYIRDGEEQEVSCEKEEWEELGVEFAGNMLKTRVCRNHCVFCFIDQMPKGCRPTLYVKDDDWRMSLMMGNFVTLTNVDDQELNRIVRRHASPLYISIHATDGKVRKALMRNPTADRIMKQLKTLAAAGIQFHGQVVLCPGLNDGEVLEKTIADLAAMHPAAQSLAVVPVGLTGHREGLFPLRPFTAQEADDVVRQIARWQKKCYKELGTRFVYASDEFYCIAGRKLPKEASYEDFAQIENGVGLFAQLRAEFDEAMEGAKESAEEKRYTIACGVSAAPLLREMIFAHQFEHLQLDIVPVKSEFFGGAVTVTGLTAGGDLVRDLAGIETDAVLITESMLRAEGDLFLDGMTLEEVQARIGVPLHVVENNGSALADVLLNGFGG